MKRSEIKKMTTEEIVVQIFYMGVSMCNASTKKQEKELEWYCDELAKREVVVNGKKLYESMCQ